VSSRNAQWVVVLLSLVVVGTTKAAPTVANSSTKLAARPVSSTSDVDSLSISEAGLLSATRDSALADVAAEFLKPPSDFANLSALPPGTRPLPAVPAALFMCLTGFLCVSLVKDHKVWLAFLASLLWVSQAGFTALPQKCRVCLAHHLNKRWALPTIPSPGQRASRLRSDIEGTQYIGLLYHLEGIPCKEEPHVKRGAKYLAPPFRRGLPQYATRTTHYESPQFAIIGQLSHLLEAIVCLTYEFRQFFCFSPAFIFESLPRGPPTLA